MALTATILYNRLDAKFRGSLITVDSTSYCVDDYHVIVSSIMDGTFYLNVTDVILVWQHSGIADILSGLGYRMPSKSGGYNTVFMVDLTTTTTTFHREFYNDKKDKVFTSFETMMLLGTEEADGGTDGSDEGTDGGTEGDTEGTEGTDDTEPFTVYPHATRTFVSVVFIYMAIFLVVPCTMIRMVDYCYSRRRLYNQIL
jgi:hypothetical protein